MARTANGGSRTKARKRRALARRDGNRCTYCRRRFHSNRRPTIDHVAPYSLFPTWDTAHLVLACDPCNQAKADRIPLLLALQLARYAVTPHVTAPAPTQTLTLPVWATLARLTTASPGVTRVVTPVGQTPDRRPTAHTDATGEAA